MLLVQNENGTMKERPLCPWSYKGCNCRTADSVCHHPPIFSLKRPFNFFLSQDLATTSVPFKQDLAVDIRNVEGASNCLFFTKKKLKGAVLLDGILTEI